VAVQALHSVKNIIFGIFFAENPLRLRLHGNLTVYSYMFSNLPLDAPVQRFTSSWPPTKRIKQRDGLPASLPQPSSCMLAQQDHGIYGA
jgi:hypothetical protein